MRDVTLVLVDPSESLCVEWRRAFEGLPRFEVVQGRIEALAEFD